jgi:uncharacterized protein involved in cysteine biosynthesis
MIDLLLHVVLILIVLGLVVPFLIYLYSKAQMAGWISAFLERFPSHNNESEDQPKEEQK